MLRRHLLALHRTSEEGKDYEEIHDPNKGKRVPADPQYIKAWRNTKTNGANLNRSGMYEKPARFGGGITAGLRLGTFSSTLALMAVDVVVCCGNPTHQRPGGSPATALIVQTPNCGKLGDDCHCTQGECRTLGW